MTLILYFILSTFLTSIIFKFIMGNSPVKNYINLYDYPNNRKIHTEKILKIGGIVILFSSLMALFVYRLFKGEDILHIHPREFDLFASGTFILLGALLDDIIGINAPKKMFFQFISIFILINSGYTFQLFNSYLLNVLSTIFFLILIINSMNLIDGIDGLSSSLFLLFSVFVFCINDYLSIFDSSYLIVLAIFLGSLFSFFIFNFPPAKIFLGDTGSQLLGWMLAVYVLHVSKSFSLFSQKIYVFSIISLPLYDVFFVIIKRYLTSSGNFINKISSIVSPDQNHIHHLLLQSGLSSLKSMLIISSFYFLCLLLSFIPVLTQNFHLIIFIIILGLNVMFRLFFEKRRKLYKN